MHESSINKTILYVLLSDRQSGQQHHYYRLDKHFVCAVKFLKGYKCLECGYKTHLKVFFDKHRHDSQQIFESPAGYTCTECRKFRSYSLLLLMKHRDLCTGKRAQKPSYVIWYKCGQCVFESRNRPEVEEHARSAHFSEEIWCKCRDCGHQTGSSCAMRRHIMSRHAGDKWLECAHCPYKAKLRMNLMRHMKVHTEIKEFQCEQCSNLFSTRRLLWLHMNAKHSSPDEVTWIRCEQCEFRTKWPVSLKRHVKVSHCPSESMVWLQCDQCEFRTPIRHRLEHHKLVHAAPEEIRWFQCDRCPYKAKCKAYLARHVEVKHTAPDLVKWFHCEFCAHKSKEKSNLNRHVQAKHKALYTQIGSMKCDFCDYRTDEKLSLTRHVSRKHKSLYEEKWLACDRCEFKSKYKGVLKRHVSSNHANDAKWFECEQCFFTTKLEGELDQHLKLHQGDADNVVRVKCEF